jgi:hypothetical protein
MTGNPALNKTKKSVFGLAAGLTIVLIKIVACILIFSVNALCCGYLLRIKPKKLSVPFYIALSIAVTSVSSSQARPLKSLCALQQALQLF